MKYQWFPVFPPGSERSMRDAPNPAGGRMIIPPLPSHLGPAATLQHPPAYRFPLRHVSPPGGAPLLSLPPFSFPPLPPAGGLEATEPGVGEISGRGGGRERDTDYRERELGGRERELKKKTRG